MNSDPETISRLLVSWGEGDAEALDDLMPLVYKHLRGMAANQLRAERGNHTLQTDALVNEAYMRLVKQEQVQFHDRAHFYAIAARMMRRVLVDHARGKNYAKRKGELVRLAPEHLEGISLKRPADILALDEALHELAEENKELSEIVVLFYFGGLTSEDIGAVMDMGSATVKRRLRLARAWLKDTLQGTQEAADDEGSPSDD